MTGSCSFSLDHMMLSENRNIQQFSPLRFRSSCSNFSCSKLWRLFGDYLLFPAGNYRWPHILLSHGLLVWMCPDWDVFFLGFFFPGLVGLSLVLTALSLSGCTNKPVWAAAAVRTCGQKAGLRGEARRSQVDQGVMWEKVESPSPPSPILLGPPPGREREASAWETVELVTHSLTSIESKWNLNTEAHFVIPEKTSRRVSHTHTEADSNLYWHTHKHTHTQKICSSWFAQPMQMHTNS